MPDAIVGRAAWAWRRGLHDRAKSTRERAGEEGGQGP